MIVTGGASGIGEAVVRAFADSGARVGIINRSTDSVERSLKNALADHADRIRWRIADVADEAAVVAAVDELSSELGGVQAVVASAGVEGEFGAGLGEVTSAGFRRVLEVNVLGVFHLVKAALPHLVRQEDPSVTIIGSDSGFVSVPPACWPELGQLQGDQRGQPSLRLRVLGTLVVPVVIGAGPVGCGR